MVLEKPAAAEKKFEKQFRFLVTCLQHTSDGRTNWNALIAEQNIVNVSAAKRRLGRMLAPYGITERSLTGFSGQKAKKEKNDNEDTGKKGSPKKKRKVANIEDMGKSEEEEGEGEEEEEEEESMVVNQVEEKAAETTVDEDESEGEGE